MHSLEYGEDSDGNVCGQNNIAEGVVPSSVARDLRGRDYLYFPLSAPTYLSLNLTYVLIELLTCHTSMQALKLDSQSGVKVLEPPTFRALILAFYDPLSSSPVPFSDLSNLELTILPLL